MSWKRLDIGNPEHRALLSWVGRILATIVVCVWAVFTYVFPPKGGHGGTSCAENASIATQGDVSHAIINAPGATLKTSGPSACGNAAAKKP